jgi:hypothetical protein
MWLLLVDNPEILFFPPVDLKVPGSMLFFRSGRVSEVCLGASKEELTYYDPVSLPLTRQCDNQVTLVIFRGTNPETVTED